MKTKRAIFLRKFGTVVGYIVLFIVFSGIVYGVCVWTFTIKDIVVIGNNIRIQVNSSRLPKTLLLFPSSAIRVQLLQENPVLADIRFQKKYPHTLVIIPTVRTPVVRLLTVTREVLLDRNGIVLSDADLSDRSLPQLVVPLPAVRTGETIQDPRVIAGITLVLGIRDIVPVDRITIEDDQSLRAGSTAIDIVFPQNGDMRAVLATLQTLLTGFRIKGTLPTFIDLRFNKPIVKF